MAKRKASCPLCGARLTSAQVLDACCEIVGPDVLECHCPFCQGYFEVRPVTEAVEIGYRRNGGFDVVVTLPAVGLTMLRDTDKGVLWLRLAGQSWKFDT
ncbi:hypothetical protein GWK36_11865 [Caldichromatium japonicum]|uniref:Uncharacterized protein n=1 Tax=Caldichromatium japonicum TaxID=2699430 RepID=A0A6G7VF33_9GAMM|nr:hypothetical protein [Caldichromatium japonicum]QIK38562.1 hypothetical protein GWK36_11865 [Caldichromatium japonicum]